LKSKVKYRIINVYPGKRKESVIKMQIAIIGLKPKLCDDVERCIENILKESSEIVISRYDIEKRVKPIPQDVCALFVIIDSIKAMTRAGLSSEVRPVETYPYI
jgi:hypothetical protein